MRLRPLLLAWLACAASAACAQGEALRVCADPNNLPFSNARGEGFENRLAALLADALGARLETVWWAQRRGFLRNTLNAHRCDVVMGLPAGSGGVLTTAPYYRSSYALVYRADAAAAPRSLDDPALARLRIGVHFVGDDYRNPPPAQALARRGLVENVVGYSLYGDYREPNPPARLLDAVAARDVDVAVVWGPLAGYFARREPVKLRVVPLAATPAEPFEFAIAAAVRKDDEALRQRLDTALASHRAQVDALLARYGVPRADAPQALAARP